MPFVTLVVGPAGVGKSSFVDAFRSHLETQKRTARCINLDPAADEFRYPVSADVRQLVDLEEVMSEIDLGPNGALVYAMEYLLQNIDWLQDEMHQLGDDEYFIFDCPGQIELYSHVPAMRNIVLELQRMGCKLCAVYLLDSQFAADAAKFISGVMCCLSAMTSIEVPYVNVLSKCDLLGSAAKQQLDDFLDADADAVRERLDTDTGRGFHKLNSKVCDLIDEWNLVQFLPLDLRDTSSLDEIVAQIDNVLQYHDDAEPRMFDESEVEGGSDVE